MLAATSICAFSPSGRRRVMRAENESSPPDGVGSAPLPLPRRRRLGIATGEANLDPAGHRVGKCERRFADDVEQSQVKRRAERLGQPAAGVHCGLVAGERCGRGEILLDRVDVMGHLHDPTMTSL